MLDINKIRDNKEEVGRSLSKRTTDFDLDEILSIDDKRKELLSKVELLKAKRNKESRQKPTPEAILELKKLGDTIKTLDDQVRQTELSLKEKLSVLPNIVADDVPEGNKENNKVIKVFGKKPEFLGKNHVQLAQDLNLIDYERGAKMSGSGFWVYKDRGAVLEWALLNYFIDFHRKNKYVFLFPPYLLTERSAFTSGHLPKFRDDLYWTQDGLCLDGTSEMMIGNYHRDEILEKLPLKYFAYSACFRKEAGSYRKEERGMVRGHQFNKIEMFQFTHPEKSWEAFEELRKNAEKLIEGLGLHYQTVLLAVQDISFAMAKTIDLEVWIPSMGIYKEVSSISNALDYQARRGNVKFRESGKNDFVHTLNASGLATSRLIPAILEQFQQKDGSVKVPRALHKYTGFKKIK
ncbi:serine--tRNA ligase [Patescibacteria group bacterium]|nr:serine--tRNA ligase [Patescibacteria group bacterium]